VSTASDPWPSNLRQFLQLDSRMTSPAMTGEISQWAVIYSPSPERRLEFFGALSKSSSLERH
jgi:hypothetical protein